MCDFCEGNSVWTSQYVDVKLDDTVPFFGSALSIYNLRKGCPSHSNCSSRDVDAVVHFEVKYCPMCGRKLTDEMR